MDEHRLPRFALVPARDGRRRRVRFAVQRHLVGRRRVVRVQRELHGRALGRRRAAVCVHPRLIRVGRDILIVLPCEGDDAQVGVGLRIGSYAGVGRSFPGIVRFVVTYLDNGSIEDVAFGSGVLLEIIGGILLFDPIETDLSIGSGHRRVGSSQGNSPGCVGEYISRRRAIGILVQHEFGARDRFVIF